MQIISAKNAYATLLFTAHPPVIPAHAPPPSSSAHASPPSVRRKALPPSFRACSSRRHSGDMLSRLSYRRQALTPSFRRMPESSAIMTSPPAYNMAIAGSSDTLSDWIPGQARYDDESKHRHSGACTPAVIQAHALTPSFQAHALTPSFRRMPESSAIMSRPRLTTCRGRLQRHAIRLDTGTSPVMTMKVNAVIPAHAPPPSFRRMLSRRHFGACPHAVIPAHAGILCNNESPPAYNMPGQAPATRY